MISGHATEVRPNRPEPERDSVVCDPATPSPHPSKRSKRPYKVADHGYDASHGYGPGHGGPTGPGDAPGDETRGGATPNVPKGEDDDKEPGGA